MHASYPEICAFCGQNPPLKAYTVNRINLPIPRMRPQSLPFFDGELEHEIRREPRGVAAHLFVEAFGGHAVELRQSFVEQYAMTAQNKNRATDVRGSRHSLRAGHREYRVSPSSTCRTSTASGSQPG